MPGQPGSYGSGKMRDERDTQWRFFWGGAGGLRKHRTGNQTVILTEFRHTRGLNAVSELEEEKETWRKTRGGRDIGRDRNRRNRQTSLGR